MAFKYAANAETLAPPTMGVDSDGLFKLCPTTNNYLLASCVSSEDDRPPYFVEPWMYDGSFENVKRRLSDHILYKVRGASIISGNNNTDSRYIRVRFQSERGLGNRNVIDDCEFYFTPNDSTIQFHSFRRDGSFDFGENKERLAKIALALHLESVPVLRNRRRTLIFVESPLDSFGPPTVIFDKAVDSISGDEAYSRGVTGFLEPSFPIFESKQMKK
eukprot:gene9738-20252_t